MIKEEFLIDVLNTAPKQIPKARACVSGFHFFFPENLTSEDMEWVNNQVQNAGYCTNIAVLFDVSKRMLLVSSF